LASPRGSDFPAPGSVAVQLEHPEPYDEGACLPRFRNCCRVAKIADCSKKPQITVFFLVRCVLPQLTGDDTPISKKPPPYMAHLAISLLYPPAGHQNHLVPPPIVASSSGSNHGSRRRVATDMADTSAGGRLQQPFHGRFSNPPVFFGHNPEIEPPAVSVSSSPPPPYEICY
jgi:hypothetical protein